MMDLHELLPLYALGVLSPEEAAAVERALTSQPQLRHELARYQATAGELAYAVAPVAPSAEVQQRLLSAIGAGRFERFATAMARLFDVTLDGARELLGWIDNSSKWEPMNELAKVIHFPAGPACAGADTGFVVIHPGGTFPYHRHGGDEITLVLAGRAIDSNGRVLQVGDEINELPGTQHDLTNDGTEDFLYAARVYGLDYEVKKPGQAGPA